MIKKIFKIRTPKPVNEAWFNISGLEDHCLTVRTENLKPGVMAEVVEIESEGQCAGCLAFFPSVSFPELVDADVVVTDRNHDDDIKIGGTA